MIGLMPKIAYVLQRKLITDKHIHDRLSAAWDIAGFRYYATQ